VPALRRTFTEGFAGSRSRRLGAFTVLEVLMVIALIAMLTGVLVTGSARLANGRIVTPEDVFWKAVTETRKAALLSGREVRLSFADKDKELALVAQSGGEEQRFAFETAGELKMNFLSTQKGSSSILLGGQLIETQTIPYVTFYGDGTCSPFRLQIRVGTGEARTIAIDPWTCSLVLPAGAAQR